jgi:UDPglucose--hexose-1-phosphate uridylyltransferase
MAEMRVDPIVGRWVLISTERAKRPHDFPKQKVKVDHNSIKNCVFCEEHEYMTPPEITSLRNGVYDKTQGKPHADKPGWQVRVVPNKYGPLNIGGSPVTIPSASPFTRMDGVGACEVIIESPDHYKDLHAHDISHLERIIYTYQERITDLYRDSRFRFCMLFKNYGAAAGASKAHPHTQLYALPNIPKRITEELRGSEHYWINNHKCIFCDTIKWEQNHDKDDPVLAGNRIVKETNDFIAFEPYASRFPYETWVLPKFHNADFREINDRQRHDLAVILKDVLTRIKVTLEDPPYNWMLHTSPSQKTHGANYHWHMEITPKLTKMAGFELGTGFYINPTPPEVAAEDLRKALK